MGTFAPFSCLFHFIFKFISQILAYPILFVYLCYHYYFRTFYKIYNDMRISKFTPPQA